MSIIKRKKQDKFFIMSNHAAQENLISLSSIGLLAYITSLPEDWILHKTFLQKKFTRRTVDGAWAELVDKKYIAGFSCYVDRKKQYYYIASDEVLDQNAFDEFVNDTIQEITETGFIPKNLQPIKDNQFSVAQNVQHTEEPSDDQNVQHKKYSTNSTVHNEQVQRNTNKEIKQIHKNKDKDVNNENINFIFEDLFSKHNDGIFSKNEWNYICNQLLKEMNDNNVQPHDLYAYLDGCVQNIAHKRRLKLGIHKPIPFYNWLDSE